LVLSYIRFLRDQPAHPLVIDNHMSDEINLAAMAQTLSKSPDYRVLRRLSPRTHFTPCDGQPTKIGILLDVETTGLDTARDEVIELAMVKFAYLPDGRIAHVLDEFSAFNEPSIPIPAEIFELTNITDDMVRGNRIDAASVDAFVADAVIIIAHNAGFDRKFAERYWPTFSQKPWGCSTNEIEWRKHGFDGSRLGYLLSGAGLFHQGHRAVDDCRALLEILAIELPKSNRPALAVLLESARRKTLRIWAEHSPFDLKDELKRRKYRWSDGAEGRPKSWFIDVEETNCAAELQFLKAVIYMSEIDPRIETMTALNRYSNRA
jgi:DNA polymerase-3 subunit epsilon